MIPAAFDYEVAESVDHAIHLLGRDPDVKLLAGGQSLLPAMRLRIARPTKLVDVGRLAELSYVRDDGDMIAVGALTRHAEVAGNAILREHCPLLAHAAGQVGDPQVRHRGTIGGSVSHGDPAGDMPTVVLALGGQLVVRGSGGGGEASHAPPHLAVAGHVEATGERVIEADAFFTGVFQTALEPGEVLTEIRVPKLGPATGWSYVKMSRRAQDWATVAVAAVVERSNGSPAKASIALTNMGATPLRATAAEEAIAGGASTDDASALMAEGTEPGSDHAASADFRRHLARVLGRRALQEATAG
ncbi:MAG: carbon monoxide dehydrogenase [Actinobacteria bacterium RBG_16_68_12]|nr:MAG: carbon monoxide dehydrogenase [Actinobacteria bacterium RBG_16_68_12]